MSSIRDKHNPSKFDDYHQIEQYQDNSDKIIKFITDTILYIRGSGVHSWLGKSFNSYGEIYFIKLKDSFLKEIYWLIKINNKYKKCSLYGILIENKRLISRDNIYFRPDNIDINGHFNLFTGIRASHEFQLQPKDVYENLLSDHLKYIKYGLCIGNSEYYDYFMRWLSNVILQPYKRPKIILWIKYECYDNVKSFWTWIAGTIGFKYYTHGHIRHNYKQIESDSQNILTTLWSLDSAEFIKIYSKIDFMLKNERNYANYILMSANDFPSKLFNDFNNHLYLEEKNIYNSFESWLIMEEKYDEYHSKILYEYLHYYDNKYNSSMLPKRILQQKISPHMKDLKEYQNMEYIYFIGEEPYNNAIKIGKTRKNISQRIKSLQTGNKNQLILIGYLVKSIVDKYESYLHRIYANRRINGEWFRFTKEELNDNIKHIDGYIECNE